MQNERVKQIVADYSSEQLKFVNTGYIHQRQVNYDELAQQIVGETIVAILATDTRSVIYTTYDKDQVQGIISLVVDQVRNHWEFK